MHPSLRSTLLLAVALLVSARLARAQATTSVLSDPSVPGDATLLVGGADARGHHLLRARLVFDYAREPLVLIADTEQSYAVVESQSVLHAQLSYALFHRVLTYASLPVVLATEGAASLPERLGAVSAASSAALGDLRFGARVHLLGESGAAWQLGATLEGRAPLGTPESYASEERFGMRASLAVAKRSSALASAFELGFRVRESTRFGGVLPTRVGSELGFGGAVQLPIDRRGRLWLGPEVSSWLTLGGGARLFDPRSSRVQMLLGGRYRPLALPLEVSLAVGPSLGRGAGSPDYRALAGLGWVPEMPPPPPDADRDGIPDASDVCLHLPGSPSNDPLMHGCPEVPLDTDGDAIPDAFDACPRKPGISTARRRTHGCPKEVEKPFAPRAPTATLVDTQIVLEEQVQFESGTAVLLVESAPILESVARVMQSHPELRRVEVAGHTDDTGTPDFNQRLSQERAEAVADWLAAHGISPARLEVRGYGASRPLTDNSSEAGKAKNRRVEFHVLERGAQP